MNRGWMRLSLAAGLLVAGCVANEPGRYGTGAPYMGPPPGRELIGRLHVDGPNVRQNGAPGRDGARVYDGDTVTTGPGSSAKIEFAAGGFIQLDENTDPEFRLLREAGCLLVKIFSGQAFIAAKEICIEDSNIDGVMNSSVNLRTDRVTSVLTVLEGSVDLRRPTARRLGAGHQYTVRGRAVATRFLTPAQARATADWTRRYFRPKPQLFGLCCDNGRLSRTTLERCQRVKGAFYTDPRQAERSCQPPQPVGYCCDNGRLSRTTLERCQRARGAFYADPRQAERSCQPPQPVGYCCANGRLSKSTLDSCRRARGAFFTDPRQAERSCTSPQKTGWCCTREGLSQGTLATCSRLRGKFFADRDAAAKSCPAPQIQ